MPEVGDNIRIPKISEKNIWVSEIRIS